MPKQSLLVTVLALFATAGYAQSITLQVPRNIQAAYAAGTRNPAGTPGEKYWQNTASYTIAVNVNPYTRLISGTVAIDYVNHSPDTLAQVWFKLYPNLYKAGSIRMMPISPQDVTDGVHISSFSIDGRAVDTNRLRIQGTNMQAPVAKLLPGQTMHFDISYSYTLNRTSHIRTGEIEPGAAFVAYFFPRIAVFDDIDGWNRYPYIGTQEFYNDFCNFNLSVTMPANYVVWATGDFTNCADVLNEPFCSRLQEAGQKDGITTIIDTPDLRQKNITKQNAVNTWKFTASNVTDMAFAFSDHYIWKSSSLVVDKSTGRRTRVDAVFNPKHKSYFRVIDFARATVKDMSYVFPKWPYPYPHETVFDGLDQMEYPMMVNDNPLEGKEDDIELTDHEIFHTMFPFYMGINETKYGWMDEGWATIGEWIISPLIDSTIVDEYGVGTYENEAGKEVDAPITSLTTETEGSLFINSYPKPAMGYLYVKDMLGDSLFTKALHYYIQQWHGKHPLPYDFFGCMNIGSGKNLDWFWKRWFMEGGVPDLGIKEVKRAANGYSITVVSKGSKPVPVDLTITFSDGTTAKLHRSVAVWEHESNVTIPLSTKKTITGVTLGSTYVPDVDKKDNEWHNK